MNLADAQSSLEIASPAGHLPSPVLTMLPGESLAGGKARAERGQAAKRLRIGLLSARIAADGALLVVAFLVAWWLRLGLRLGQGLASGETTNLPFYEFYPYMAAYALATMLMFQARGLYAIPRGATWFDHMRVIASASLIGVSLITLGALAFNASLPSRLLFIYLWGCTLILFGLERFAYRRLRIWLWARGINIRRVLVVGDGVSGQRIIKDIVERSDLGYRLAGYLSDGEAPAERSHWSVPVIAPGKANLRRLGSVKDVAEVIEGEDLHEVIVSLPATQHSHVLRIIDSCRSRGLEFRLVPDLFEMRFNEVRIDALNGVPLIGVKNVALSGFNLLVKRGLDLGLALAILLLAALPMLLIAAAVKLTSPGPVLFRQKRVGKEGRVFTLYKFRSMCVDAEARLAELRHLNEADGPIFKIRDDPRLTPIGRVLRRASLDELPQLFNIIRGEMSWVGPRPPTVHEVAQYNSWHRKRLDVTPGLTGLWQVSGRSALSFDEMVKLDLYYAENWSLAFDAVIILRTVPAVLRQNGAY